MADVQFAEEVSRRASVALDNAGLFRDLSKKLSERKRIEAALRQVSERLELAQEAANIGAFERDLVTNRNCLVGLPGEALRPTAWKFWPQAPGLGKKSSSR